MRHPLIGLYSPRAQSGKSTAARHIASRMNGVTMSFADPMREALIPVVAPFIGSEDEVRRWFADERKDHAMIPGLGVTLRFMLQTLGTAWGRETVHPELWCMIAKATSRLNRASNLTVIDDLRFEDEYALIKREGGLLVKIVRPDAPASGNFWHKSEARLENLPFDETVTNWGEISDLHTSINGVLRAHFGA